MLRVANRVKESTLTSGSGTIALAGASNGYQSFSSVLSNGDTSYYTIVNGDSWEVGIGTYSSNTLSRDVVLSSSNSNNKLDLNGQSYVFIAYPSEKSVYKDQNDQVVVGSSGVIIGSGNPFITSNVLYNSGGILYFNGLPVGSSISITGVSGIGVSQSGNSYTISATGSFGLTSSQIQQLLNSGVSINVTSGTGNFNSLSVGGTPASISGHTHLSSSITDFNSSVSGLIPVKNIVNSGYIVVSSSGGVFTIGVTGLQPSGNYSLSGHNHTASNITDFNSAASGLLTPYALLNSGNFTSLFITGMPVSVSGHTHTSSQITDFNTSVNSLVSVKNVSGSGYVNVLATTGNYIVSVSGLQPTGNYSLVGHSHTVSDITNFNTGVSGLLPSVSGNGYVAVLLSNNIYIVSVTGLQPSGNYSVSGHTHTSSNITDFNSATSGLLTPYALLNSGNFTNLYVAGTVVSLSGHTHASSSITDFSTTVSGLLPFTGVIGSGNVVINSSNRILNISTSGLQPSGNYSVSGHQHSSSDITNFNPSVSGLLTPYSLLSSGNFTTLLVAGTPVSLSGHSHTVSDISNFGSGVSGLLPVKDLLPGTNVTITSNSGIYTINSSGGGGGGSVSVSNPGSGRVLTSDGTSSGIIGQSGLTFSNNSLFINGVNVNNGKNLFLWSTYR